jgi:hypothetical protein
MHDFAGRRPVQQFDIRAGDAVERHVHQPWCSAHDCPCAAADPASAACAAVIWAAATCARRHLPACDGLVLGSIRSYRRSRYLLTRPVSRIVLSPLLQLVSSRRFAGFSSAARGQFECALQRSQRDVPPRLHEPFRDVEIVGDLRRRPTCVVRAARTRAAFSSSGSPRSGAFQVSARCMKWISLVGSE